MTIQVVSLSCVALGFPFVKVHLVTRCWLLVALH